MVYVGVFAGSRPCLAEVSDWLAVAVKNVLSEAIRAIPILEHLSGAATFDDGSQPRRARSTRKNEEKVEKRSERTADWVTAGHFSGVLES